MIVNHLTEVWLLAKNLPIKIGICLYHRLIVANQSCVCFSYTCVLFVDIFTPSSVRVFLYSQQQSLVMKRNQTEIWFVRSSLCCLTEYKSQAAILSLYINTNEAGPWIPYSSCLQEVVWKDIFSSIFHETFCLWCKIEKI